MRAVWESTAFTHALGSKTKTSCTIITAQRVHLEEVRSWERPLLKIAEVALGTATVILLPVSFESDLS